MANVYEAPPVYRALDRELVKVGRAVRGSKAMVVADNLHHCWSRRRKMSFRPSYMLGDGEITSPTRGIGANTEYRTSWTTGPHTRWVRVSAVAAGSSGSSGVPALTLTVSGGTPVTFALAPRDVGLTGAKQHYVAIAAVTPDTTETFVIDQSAGSNSVRIVSLGLDEMPNRDVAVADATISPTGILSSAQFAGATDIIDTEHDDLFIAAQQLRRYHVPVAFSLGKHFVKTTNTYSNIALGSVGLAWDLYLAPVLGERTGTGITCRVFGTDSSGGAAGANGHVRFTWSDASTTTVDVDAASAWYSASDTISKNSDTVVIQAMSQGSAQLDVYAIVIEQTAEAT